MVILVAAKLKRKRLGEVYFGIIAQRNQRDSYTDHLTTLIGLYLYHNLPILQIHNSISYQIGHTDTDTDIHSWLYQLV